MATPDHTQAPERTAWTIRLFKEGEKWIAQAHEQDICAQGETKAVALERLGATIALENDMGNPIAPCPDEVWKRFGGDTIPRWSADMDAAPKDGTFILGWTPYGGLCLIHWETPAGIIPSKSWPSDWYENWPSGWHDSDLAPWNPTHWMPITPPEDTK